MEFKIIVIVLIMSVRSFCANVDYMCDEESSIDISKGKHLDDGDITFKGVTYKNSEYIVDNITGLERGCLCAKKKCIRKCCPIGYGYHIKEKICVEVADEFDPPVWNKYRYISDAKISDLFQIFVGKVNCTGELRTRAAIASDEYHLVNVSDFIPYSKTRTGHTRFKHKMFIFVLSVNQK